MRIGMASYEFSDHGGVQRYVVEVAKRLSQDHSVVILASHKQGVKLPGVEFAPVPMPKLFGACLGWKQLLVYNLSLARVKEHLGLDILHGNNTFGIGADVVTMHSCHRAYLDFWYRTVSRQLTVPRRAVHWARRYFSPFHLVYLLLERQAVNNGSTHHIVCISARLKDELKQLYGVREERLRVVHHGVDTNRFQPRVKQRDAIRSSLGVGLSDTLVLFLANRPQGKGLDVAIEALRRIKDSGVKLLVAGIDYAHRAAYIPPGMTDRILVVGKIKNPEEYYAAADVCLMPTLYDAFGMVALEAMACGLPVLVSRRAGVSEVIQDGISGILLDEPSDVDEVCEKLGALVGDPVRRNELGVGARVTAEHLSWDSVVASLAAVYDQMT